VAAVTGPTARGTSPTPTTDARAAGGARLACVTRDATAIATGAPENAAAVGTAAAATPGAEHPLRHPDPPPANLRATPPPTGRHPRSGRRRGPRPCTPPPPPFGGPPPRAPPPAPPTLTWTPSPAVTASVVDASPPSRSLPGDPPGPCCVQPRPPCAPNTSKRA